MKRITIKLGKISRRFVLTNPPYPKVGDAVTIKGERAEWVVYKVSEAGEGLAINFPSRVSK